MSGVGAMGAVYCRIRKFCKHVFQERPGGMQRGASEADGPNGGVCVLYLDERLKKARARVQNVSWRAVAVHSRVRRTFQIKARA